MERDQRFGSRRAPPRFCDSDCVRAGETLPLRGKRVITAEEAVVFVVITLMPLPTPRAHDAGVITER